MEYYIEMVGKFTLVPLLVKRWETHLETKHKIRIKRKKHIQFILHKKDQTANLASKWYICPS